ncbi:regulatory protein [Hyphomicrobium nitrativorans NL23]|uniref:Regulatory protein n=1 Tax=Hyphomicrobium nitrativorans NL23 TaxID=1029756 RepID=V5SEE9_9HYPH|nr:regulatory protein [Hyphomicrobium nitrativorans NL23]
MALVLVAFAAVLPAVAGERSTDVELIMVDDPACRFCQKWNEAVGKGYAKSPEGAAAPLKRVPRGAPELQGLAPVIYTPTFIVMDGGGEVGRISGYSGPSYFYSDLRDILARAGHLRGS